MKETPTAVRFGLGSHAEGFSLVLVTSMRDVLVAHFAELTHSAYVDWKWMSYRLKPVVQQQVEGMRLLSKELFGAEALIVTSERYCDNPKVVVRDTNKYGLALFAKDNILAREIVAFFDGEIYEADRASDIPNDPPEFIQEHVLQFDSRR